ncbi:MAG: gluconate 2-dehydrogenase subunit 3 family protein [Bacteroidota bacterium]
MFDTPIGRRAALRRISLALGGLATAPLASALLSGCRTPEPGALPDYAYQSLSEDHQRTLAALVDQILPATDTPGAAEAGVPQFIDAMLTDWYTPEERDAFLEGLTSVDARAEGGSFADLAPDAQIAMVVAMDAEAFGAPDDAPPSEAEVDDAVLSSDGDLDEIAEADGLDPDQEQTRELSTGEGTASVGSETTDVPFYRQLKELTVAGYYTSEVGATEELRWQAAPGRYDPDVPFFEIGRAWA